jgi:hypothetical protein
MSGSGGVGQGGTAGAYPDAGRTFGEDDTPSSGMSGRVVRTRLPTIARSVSRLEVRRHLWIAGLSLGVLGLLSRLLIAWISIGNDDAHGWHYHSAIVREHGVRFAYENSAALWKFNHPPLMGYWAAFAKWISEPDFQTFTMWMKAPGLLAELMSAALIYRIWAKHDRSKGAWAFAAYGLSLPLIFVSGYHCNTDAIYAGLTLLAMYWMQETRRPFWAGLALAAALNVKILPIFLVPPLLAQCRSPRELLRVGVGLALGILPYLPFLVISFRAVYANMVAYNSQQTEWGLMAFVLQTAKTPAFAEYAYEFRDVFVPYARYLILLVVLVFSVIAAIRRRPNGYELGALAWALFLVFTPGYGVQYSVCVLPLLFAADRGRAVLYSLSAGVMLFFMYTARLKYEIPLYAEVENNPFPPAAVLFGVLAWCTLVAFVLATVRKMRRDSHPDVWLKMRALERDAT